MTVEEAITRIKDHMIIHKINEPRAIYISEALDMAIKALEQELKVGYCKECKYFEYDSVANVDEIPLIVAHEICSRWGRGCKTKEDGYCFLFEPQESEVRNKR